MLTFHLHFVKILIYCLHHLQTDVSRRYQTLTITEKSPKLPAGYLSLAPLLWFPPIWRRTMDPILKRYEEEWRKEDSQLT